MMSPHTGIEGLQGREPIGAVIAIGVKGPSGAPIEKDRFHVLWPQENAEGKRPHHPQFKTYNEAPPVHRQMVVAQIVHATVAECFEFNYRNQSVKNKPMHPAKVPFCTGNGCKARRYMGKRGDEPHVFDEIPCPADKCEYRQGDRPACKPWMRALFRVILSDKLPTPLTKYTSGSWNTIRNFVGFFELLEKQAVAIGLASPNLLGFEFALQLTERTNAEKKSRFPVVRVVPLDDPIAFFSAQLDRRDRARQLGGPVERPIAALTDREQSHPLIEASDHANHTPGLHTSKDDDISEETP